MIGEGHVFHSRTNLDQTRFKYPSFFLSFNLSAEDELKQTLKKRFKGFLSFQASDYLRGGKGPALTLIREFLKEKLNYEADEVWLQTMPRMLGYAFNPVSFWILKKENKIDAVLVEVNNTFGERHFYWIHPDNGRLVGEWHHREKAFHVSPFQPVDGAYDFRFQIDDQHSAIDILHRAPNGDLRLATWLKGDLQPLANRSAGQLFLKYGWMTVMVPLRIHFQAFKLWRHGMKFYSKPALPQKELT